MITIIDLKENLPNFAKDIKLNLSSLIINSEEDERFVYSCAYSSALASGNKTLIDIFHNECSMRFDEEFIESVKSAVTIMTLNNIWYKYRDAMPNNELRMAPQKMRVNVMREHAGLDMQLFESISLCVSAVNGCKFLMSAHSESLLNSGKTKDYVLNIGRIASTVIATSKAMSI